ncbi:MAG: hypothetical protein F6K28_15955 [Microcoleus sp. SIO2G3]|nr:hypothetical protein [Microcoleus sp. SIO2G3]
MRIQFLSITAAIALALNACVSPPGDSIGGRPMLPPVPAGGGGAARPMAPPPVANGGDLPSQPLYAQESPQDEYWAEDGVRELHAVTSPEYCDQMANLFRQQGRNIRLVKKVRNPNQGAQLPWMCVFEGPDASASYFNDHRYNSADEY